MGNRRHNPVRNSVELAIVLASTIAAACSSDALSADTTPADDGGSTNPQPEPTDGGGTPADDGSGPDGDGTTTDAPLPVIDPDTFAAGETDVITIIRTQEDRKPISPFIYGINGMAQEVQPADVMAGITFVRRGGDRSNAYNWETNISNGSYNNDFGNDTYLADGLTNPTAPAGVDLELITKNRAAGRGTMVPFVLNDYVAGPVGGNIPYDTVGFNRNQYFKRVGLVKPSPFAATPNLNDAFVYTDEHLNFMGAQFTGQDIYAPGPTQVMVGVDNEPDLYGYNFPMLQLGSGKALYAQNGVEIGKQLTGVEFTNRFLVFAKRVREIAPNAEIVGPDHYHFDGWTTWYDSMPNHSGLGTWYMDDFLAAVKAASATAGKRLLDTWDFHWYPQRVMNGTFVWDLDHSVRTLTQNEIDNIVQGPRSYWDNTYDENSWITNDHLNGPAYILTRLFDRIATGYPGTKLGVTEYFPGGCAHIASGLATVDTLGVFARLGVSIAAMWPTCSTTNLRFAFGGIKLVRNADGQGLRFADTVVKVEHPEKVETSVFAGSDTTKRVTMLVINKTNTARKVGLRAFHTSILTKVDIHRIDAAHPSPHLAAQETLAKKNAYAYTAPPMSAAMLVFQAP